MHRFVMVSKMKINRTFAYVIYHFLFRHPVQVHTPFKGCVKLAAVDGIRLTFRKGDNYIIETKDIGTCAGKF